MARQVLNRQVMEDVLANGTDIFVKNLSKLLGPFKKENQEIFGLYVKDFCEEDNSLKIVLYRIARLRGDRQLDKSKHLNRLAIVKGDKIIQDDLLYVSQCCKGMAIICKAEQKGGSRVYLVNHKAEAVWAMNKRSELLNVIDKKTGQTYRQLLKQYKKLQESKKND